jgi:hypothetical protein
MTRRLARYYFTRDSKDGVLSNDIDAWSVKPLRTVAGGRVVWMPVDKDNPYHFGPYAKAVVERHYGTYPDDDRMVIVAEQWIDE